MKENIIKNKSYQFAVCIVQKIQPLISQNEYILSKQIIRSGTAIGALVREAEFAQSRSDFIHKLSIALKEANETRYWLDLLHETQYITSVDYEQMIELCDELIKMLVASVKTNKSKIA